MVGFGAAATALAVTAGPASADAASDAVQVNLDNVWVLVCAVLVIFMQAGFALVEAGMTGAKSVANIMMKNLIDFCAGAVAFLAVGYAIAFGGSTEGFGKFFGAKGYFLGEGAFSYGNLTVPVFFMFQVAFAATAATIVSGAMAERTKFKAYLCYSFIISLIIYPVVVRWVWGGGWLLQMDTPYHDFAGSSIVHMLGGITAFWGARELGPRLGKFGADGKPRTLPAHSVPYAILGCFILLVGWYGFNPGSELAADAAIGGIAVTTTAAGAMAALTAMATVWLRSGKPDVGMTGNGLLAGLVAITAGCAAVTPQAALIIGACAGILVVLGVEFVERVLKVDDPVGAVAVHGICGFFGTLCVGLFARNDAEGFWKQGLLYGGGTDQLVSQLIGLGAIALWTSVLAILCFKGIKAIVGLRVTEDEELQGLDILEHGTAGYGEGFGTFVPDLPVVGPEMGHPEEMAHH
jgi:Amt family ammonium transporter